MDKLKPCPFCGGEAETELCGKGIYSYWSVWCNCGVLLQDYKTEAEAIEAWNTRAERTCKFVSSRGADYPPACSECGYELGIYDCDWLDDGTYRYNGNYCLNCGRKVVEA